MFRPNTAQFNTVIRLKHRTDASVNGAPDPTYRDANPAVHYCEFKPFYGAEAIQAGQLGILEGGTITMWYTAGVKASDLVYLNNDAAQAYEVTSAENVENRGMFLVLKVKRTVTA